MTYTPGSIHDAKGVPVYPGDLIRTPHFRTRKRQYYLYHVATIRDDRLTAVPVSDLDPPHANQGGSCGVEHLGAGWVVISGYGPDAGMDYTDRKRIKPSPTPPPRTEKEE